MGSGAGPRVAVALGVCRLAAATRWLSLMAAVGLVVACGSSPAATPTSTAPSPHSSPTSTATESGWTTVASMSTARDRLAAATGPDGRIYAIGGGFGANGGNLNTVEAYTPSTNSWATLTSMPTARRDFAAATGPDGRIYAIGGAAGTGPLKTVEAYTPGTNSWATVASMPTARDRLAAVTGRDGLDRRQGRGGATECA